MAKRFRRVGIGAAFFILILLMTVGLGDWTHGPSMRRRGLASPEMQATLQVGGSRELGADGYRQEIPATVPGPVATPRTHMEAGRAHAPVYMEQEVLVQFDPAVAPEQIAALLSPLEMRLEQVLNKKNLCRIRIPDSVSVPDALGRLRDIPGVLFSEPNYVLHTTGVPNDTSFTSQWGLHNTGQSGGMLDADIDAPEAWDLATGSRSVVVAVVDEGVEINHPDLSANMWVNTDETAGNGVDDDGNGFVDDVNGWDFNHGDATVYDAAGEDSHGTEVAGIIGAVGNNGTGTAGVCWTVQIMPVKFIAYGSGTVANAILALNYAVENGARVINCSWGGTAFSAALKAAFEDVLDMGVLAVTSAGNSGKDTDTSSHYPSNYDLPNILSVAATDKNDTLPYFSNYGLTTVDLAAPGSSIYTTKPESQYASFSGTSASTPFVTGAAALALSVSSALTYAQLKDYILNSVDAVDALAGKTVTGGRLNVLNLISTLNLRDSDGDGLPDGYESQHGFNPNDPSDGLSDTDGDGLTNLQEYQRGTDPTNSDTDADGLPDGYEVTFGLNPQSPGDASLDQDGDGLSNLTEYQAGTRIDSTDSDGDGIDDFTEFGPRTQPADSDGDDTIDALDTDSDNDTKLDANEGVADDDDDGVLNYADMDDSDGPAGDQDGDGLTNSVEATFLLYPNLPDSDKDGIGDLAEFGPGSTPADSDGDGLIDALDLDSDNDGKTDAAEGVEDSDGDGLPNYRDGDDSDGPLGDADGDGLTNQTEAGYGLNGNLADSDGDGIDDLTEFGPGPEPLDTDDDGILDALDVDSDGDGVGDEPEDGSDTDGDGVPDRLDNTTAAMVTSYGKLALVLQGEDKRLGNVAFLANAAAEVSTRDVDFRYGGVRYEVTGLTPGETIEITLRVSTGLPSNALFWKYNSARGYYEYPAAVSGNILRFSVTDGSNGDEDGLANGAVVDPGYIVIPVETEESGGTSSPAAASGGGGGGGGGGGCSLGAAEPQGGNGLLDFLILALPAVMGAGVRLRILVRPGGRPGS